MSPEDDETGGKASGEGNPVPTPSPKAKKATEVQIGIAHTLMNVAAAIFAVVFGIIAFVVPLVSDTGQALLYGLGALATILLTLSMIYGGRGIVLGPGSTTFRDRFNLQAVTGLVAIFALLGMISVSFLFPTASAEKPLAAQVSDLRVSIERLEGQISTLESEKTRIDSKQQLAATDITALRAEVTSLRTTLESALAEINRKLNDKP